MSVPWALLRIVQRASISRKMSVSSDGGLKSTETTSSVGPTHFGVQDIACDGRHTLLLSGELDLVSSSELEAMILLLCNEATSGLALDLKGLTFMDSTGLRTVLLAKELCDRHGCELTLVPGPDAVQRVFELTNLLDVLPFQVDGSNAVAS
jgi:anti-anti-sigma factor